MNEIKILKIINVVGYVMAAFNVAVSVLDFWIYFHTPTANVLLAAFSSMVVGAVLFFFTKFDEDRLKRRTEFSDQMIEHLSAYQKAVGEKDMTQEYWQGYRDSLRLIDSLMRATK